MRHRKCRNRDIPDATTEDTSIVQSTTISNVDLRDRQPWSPNALHLAILRPQIGLLPVCNFGGSIWNKHHTAGVMKQTNLVENYSCSSRRDEDQRKQNDWLMIKMKIMGAAAAAYIKSCRNRSKKVHGVNNSEAARFIRERRSRGRKEIQPLNFLFLRRDGEIIASD